MPATLQAIYHVRSDARSIEARAQAIAVEQSVEMPVEAIDDAEVKSAIVGRVLDVADQGNGLFTVRIALAPETVGLLRVPSLEKSSIRHFWMLRKPYFWTFFARVYSAILF